MFNSSLSYQVCCESSVATGKHVVSSLLNKVCHAITSGKKSNWIPSASFTHSFSTCDKKLHTCIWLRLSQAIYIAIDENAFDSGYAVALVKLSTWECANQTTDYNIYIFYKNNHTSSTNTCWFSPQSISFCFFLYIIGLFDKTNGALFLLVTFLCSNIKGTTNFNFNFQTVMSDAVFAWWSFIALKLFSAGRISLVPFCLWKSL